MEDRFAERSADSGGGSAEVVQEVREPGIAYRIGESDRSETQVVRFGSGLARELHAIAKRVASTELGLGLLKNENIPVARRRGLSATDECRDRGETDLRQGRG